MEIPSAESTGVAVAPWLVLGVVLGVGLVVLVGLVTSAFLRRRSAGTPVDPGGDDLPGFLEFPPGSSAPVAATGWASLAAPPASPPTARSRRSTLAPVVAMAVTALLLLAAAAVVATVSQPDDRRAPSGAPAAASSRPGAEAKLTFGGVVLEQRAVGVTVTYPVVEVSSGSDGARARVELPTYNCLTGDAPADPAAAGCVRSVTEYAELASPGLLVRDHGNGLELSGRFATELRPNGGPPAPTGQVYGLHLTVTPAGQPAEDGWRPARGILELGSGRTTTVDELSVVRRAS